MAGFASAAVSENTGGTEEGGEAPDKGVAGDDHAIGAGDAIPAEFPSEVPLIDGEMRVAETTPDGDRTIWGVFVASEDPQAAMAHQCEELLSVGFKEPPSPEDEILRAFEKGDLKVSVAPLDGGDGQTMLNGGVIRDPGRG